MIRHYINIVLGGIFATLSYVFGQWDTALITLLIFICLDYFTGIMKAIHTGNLTSDISRKGIIKKVGYLVVVAVANLVCRLIGTGYTIHTVVIYMFIANEGISILENWAVMGLPTPRPLLNALKQIGDKVDDTSVSSESVKEADRDVESEVEDESD